MKRLVSIVIAAALLLTSLVASAPPAAAAEPPTWTSSYGYRVGVKILTADALANGYSIAVTLDHASLVAAGRSLASGNDVRVVRWNGSAWTELDRVLAVGSSWNNAATKIYFRTQTAIAASTADTSYYLHYGNPAAGAPPANADNVYDLFDDFSVGTINAGRWNTLVNTGVAVGVTAGELSISGSAGAGTQSNLSGLDSVTAFTSGFVVESSFRVASATTGVQNNWRAALGQTPSAYRVDSLSSATKNVVQGSNSANVAVSAITGAGQPAVRVMQTRGIGTAAYYENGTFLHSHTGLVSSDYKSYLRFAPRVASEAFDVRFDDIVIRKYAASEPQVMLEKSEGVNISAAIRPRLTFTVGTHSGACNGVAQTAGTSATATTAAIGALDPNVNNVVAQSLSVSTNARSGYTVYVRSSGPMISGSNDIDAVAASNSAPAAFPAAGTEAMGYTTSDATLGSGTADRFTNPVARWAALSTANAVAGFGAVGTLGDTFCIAYQAGASPTSAAGIYSASIVYTAVPVF